MSNLSEHFKVAAKHHEALADVHKSMAATHETVRSFHEGQGSTATGLSLDESHGHRVEQSHHSAKVRHHEKLSKMHGAHAAHLRKMVEAEGEGVMARVSKFFTGGGQDRDDDDFMEGLNMRKDAPWFNDEGSGL